MTLCGGSGGMIYRNSSYLIGSENRVRYQRERNELDLIVLFNMCLQIVKGIQIQIYKTKDSIKCYNPKVINYQTPEVQTQNDLQPVDPTCHKISLLAGLNFTFHPPVVLHTSCFGFRMIQSPNDNDIQTSRTGKGIKQTAPKKWEIISKSFPMVSAYGSTYQVMDLLYTGYEVREYTPKQQLERYLSRTPPEPESPWNGLVRASGTLGVLQRIGNTFSALANANVLRTKKKVPFQAFLQPSRVNGSYLVRFSTWTSSTSSSRESIPSATPFNEVLIDRS